MFLPVELLTFCLVRQGCVFALIGQNLTAQTIESHSSLTTALRHSRMLDEKSKQFLSMVPLSLIRSPRG